MSAMRAPIKPIERPKQEGKIISWDLNRGDPTRPNAKRRSISEQISDQIISLARQAGYAPPHVVYALAALKIPKSVAKEIIVEIFESQGHSHDKAEQMAQTQINILWDESVRKISIADNNPKR